MYRKNLDLRIMIRTFLNEMGNFIVNYGKHETIFKQNKWAVIANYFILGKCKKKYD